MERISFRKVIDTAVVVFAPTGALFGSGPGEEGGMLLDTIGLQATGAWSVRKLREAHVGSCIQVRRSGPSGPEGAEQDFGFAGRNLDTAAVLAYVGTDPSDNGFVTTWYDQSGQSHDMMQSVAAKQPKIVNAGALVTPGFLFDGASDCLEATGFTWADFISASKFTMLATVRPTSFGAGTGTDTGAIFGDSGGGFAGLGVGTVGGNSIGVYNWDGAAYDYFNYPAAINTNYVLIGQHDTSNLQAWLNSGTPGAGPNTSGETSQLTDVPQLGGQVGTWFTGHIVEALIFTVALDTDARNTLGTDMAEFIGTTWT